MGGSGFAPRERRVQFGGFEVYTQTARKWRASSLALKAQSPSLIEARGKIFIVLPNVYPTAGKAYSNQLIVHFIKDK